MIKINKDIDIVPESLIPAYLDLFPNKERIPILSENTHEKRLEVIENGSYKDEKKFNSRYKTNDIRIILVNIYHNKCAFCETKVEQYEIEHYRPKKLYHWLAFSWDNLLMACTTCNKNKGIHFQIDGQKATFINTETNIRMINSLSSSYDAFEMPKMVNPEVTDPLGQIAFSKIGSIESQDPRFAYTINKCALDRPHLNLERKTLLDIFRRDVVSALVENINVLDQEREINVIVRKFIRDAQDNESQYLAFRRFAISAGWLNDIGKNLN